MAGHVALPLPRREGTPTHISVPPANLPLLSETGLPPGGLTMGVGKQEGDAMPPASGVCDCAASALSELGALDNAIFG